MRHRARDDLLPAPFGFKALAYRTMSPLSGGGVAIGIAQIADRA